MTHTKGPWVRESNPTIEEKIQIAAFAYDGNRELQIIVRSNNVEDDLDLIAAAPDLLEALKGLYTNLFTDGFVTIDHMEKARAAIAKADGL